MKNNKIKLAVWYIKHNFNKRIISDKEIQEVADYYDVSWIELAKKL